MRLNVLINKVLFPPFSAIVLNNANDLSSDKVSMICASVGKLPISSDYLISFLSIDLVLKTEQFCYT